MLRSLILLACIALAAHCYEVPVDKVVLADAAAQGSAHVLITLNHQFIGFKARAPSGPVSDARAQALLQGLQAAAAGPEHQGVRQFLESDNCKASNIQSFYVFNGLAATVSLECLNALRTDSRIAAIENNRPFRAVLERPDSDTDVKVSPNVVEWNVEWVQAPAVWAKGFTGVGLVHANADTGVQHTHPALVNHYRGSDAGGFAHDFNWIDLSSITQLSSNINVSQGCPRASPIPCDDNGHGTHTTGTTTGGEGANEISVAPGAKWIACKNMWVGYGTPATYIGCLEFMIAPTDLTRMRANPNLRPHTVGNSYGCPPSEGCAARALERVLEAVRQAGVFMAVSAGNAGSSCSTVNDPPGLDGNVCSVGALGTRTNTIAAYSSRGPVTVDGSGRRKPDIAAPGSGVRSCYVGNVYRSLSGTSMASPAVAGVVLLLWQAFPELVRDVSRTEDLIYRSATPLYSTQTCGGDTPSTRPNNVYGWGGVDALAAFNLAQSPEFGLKLANYTRQ